MPLSRTLERSFHPLLLAPLGAVAFLDAHGITQLVSATLTLSPARLALAAPAALPHSTSTSPNFHSTSALPILRRNPFDSQTGPLDPLPSPLLADSPSSPDSTDPLHAPPCEGVRVLVIAASADPEWSFAALTTPGVDKGILRRRGDDVGAKKVEFVGWDRVWLSSPDALCQAAMFSPSSVVATSGSPSDAGAPSPLGPLTKGIRRIGPTELDIDRSVLDKILENQAELFARARIAPAREKGKTLGLQLSGVDPGTLLALLGLENGDRLQTINGFDLTSPEKALEAYARLQTSERLTLQVVRKGASVNLDFNIK